MRNALRWIVPVLLAISGSRVCLAQSINSGDIRGIVTDTTGALIPGVTVSVLNVDTGVSKDFTTNQDGLFDTSSIVAGRYTITFKREGFDRFVRGPVTVDVGFTTVNAQLKIGQVSQEVTISTDVPLLNTESGDQTATLEANTMAELPQVGGENGQDWENFMILLPGAVGCGGGCSQGASNPGQEVSTNGNLPFTNVLADGATTTLPASQNANPTVFEDIQELQVSLSSFSAQYGVGGLVINQITKGGGDKFHGSAYEYLQNDAFNAAGYQFNASATVPFLRYDNFGGTISGPVAIRPSLRKKMFFFFGYDQIVNHTVSTGFQTVPTAAVRGGDFTGGYTLYDPTTQTIAHDAKGNPYPVRKSFLEEYGRNAIPSTLFDPVSAKFQQYYPTGSNTVGYPVTGTVNSAGVDSNNWYYSDPQPRPWRRYFGRLDYDITPNNRLTMSDTQGDEIENGDNQVTNCPIACQLGDVDNNNAQITDVWNISSRTINEARIGYTDQLNFFSDSTTGQGYPAQLGWQFAKENILPAVQFVRNYPYAWIEPATNAEYKEFVYEPSDVVTMIRGKHILHFGGEIALYRDDATPWGNINAGTLQFSGQYTEQWTVDPTTGVASPNSTSGEEYADFLLGYPNNWSASYTPEFGARLKKPQMFVQDDWKLRQNLTVNLGLRYEISHGFNEITGNEATFDPTVKNDDGTLGAYWYGSTHANGRTALQANVFSTVLPRVGFSWLPKSNTTVRGGMGLYSYNFSLDNFGAGMGAAVSSSGSFADESNGIYPVTKFSGSGTLYPLGGGPSTALPYTSASTDPGRFNGQSGQFNDFNTPIPKIWQWNLGVERAFRTDYVATVAYVGSHGLDLTFPTDVNSVPLNHLSSNDTQYRPFTNFQGLPGNLYQAISNYHSLQVTINKRMSNGLSLSFNYVWSKLLDDQDSSGWGSHAGPQDFQYASTLGTDLAGRNYGLSNFDVRNAFKGYAVYQLPFGKGKMFLSNNALADAVVGGWELAGTVVETAGNPFQVFGTNNTYTQSGSQYPNLVPGVSTAAANRNPRCAPGPAPGTGGCTNAWTNPAAFSDPANGAFGALGRDPLIGPGVNYFNISGAKSFNLPWEGVKFQIRCDTTNTFNHASFGTPSVGLATPAANGIFTSAAPQQITGTSVGGRNIQLGAHLSF
ncbi:MAG: carboxypeptidase regulatory-like domain-containing protein [Terracidiphilus sp.]